jgi:hypothetical protein
MLPARPSLQFLSYTIFDTSIYFQPPNPTSTIHTLDRQANPTIHRHTPTLPPANSQRSTGPANRPKPMHR